MKLLIASGNSGKVKEIGEILRKIDKNAEILSLKDIFNEVPDIPENARNFTGNALAKASWLAERFKDAWILADDSGLVVDKLKGRPGVISAIYAGEPRSDKRNIEKLLDEMKDFTDESERKAHFCCAMVLLSPDGENSYIAIGKCQGSIAFEEKGENGFGYDPIFVPDCFKETFAELPLKVKNKISHRAKALEILSDILEDVMIGDNK